MICFIVSSFTAAEELQQRQVMLCYSLSLAAWAFNACGCTMKTVVNEDTYPLREGYLSSEETFGTVEKPQTAAEPSELQILPDLLLAGLRQC